MLRECSLEVGRQTSQRRKLRGLSHSRNAGCAAVKRFVAPRLRGIGCARPASGAHPPPISRRSSGRSEEHTSELQSLMRISYAVFCLKKKKNKNKHTHKKYTNT